MTPLIIPFSYNWNNKLDCKAFTTIRLYSPDKHVPDMSVNPVLHGKSKGVGKIKGVKKFLLAYMTEYMAYLDMGYDIKESTKVIEKMYPKVDFKTKLLAFILIVKD